MTSPLMEFVILLMQGASEAWHLPVAFISVIILPIVGNAAEHTSAIIFAVKDNLVRFSKHVYTFNIIFSSIFS